ncbi:class I SAM-dependent methyltransferase [Salarchaeum japonicum]|uniref:class I SAM-dependent methyltransferase n=1 Tax=Salarchaeum japonicum TaxID=555573 RepID=UPI001D0AC80F|nr:class I SAM-dependent methyltransferase [Salarchaeum japonicum]
MRRFSAEYLTDTRRGMWENREALAPLSLGDRERVLDVGCGTGELTRVLAEESPGEVVGADADSDLLAHVAADGRLQADATRLPVRDGAFDLVTCQALLINLPNPVAAVREFSRASSDLVAAIEPDNSEVRVESTVPDEASLAESARQTYIEGVETDVTLGRSAASVFEDAGLVDVRTRRHEHVRTVEPPYSPAELESAQRKATASRLAEQRPTLEAGGMTGSEYDRLRSAWREMGRSAVTQMQDEAYRRRAMIPFYVTVGRVPDATEA